MWEKENMLVVSVISIPIMFNSLPNSKILDLSKLKEFADNNFRVAQMMLFSSDRVENTVGKGENAGHQHFLLFLQCFQKAFFLGIVKSPDCVVNSSDRAENTVEKGENAGHQHFLLFLQCFQKAFFLRVINSPDCFVKS